MLSTAALAAEAAAQRFVAVAREAIRARGQFVVILAGGSTPRSMYARLAAPPHAASVDWSRVQVLWGDERCVPPDHAASNYRMACEALLDHVPIFEASVHRIHGEDDPVEAAAVYERVIRRVLRTPTGPPPAARIDLVLLGLGEDGHTASLFPGQARHDNHAWVRAVYVPASAAVATWRVTLTPAIINSAAEVAFLVSGAAKAAIVRQVLEGPPNRPTELPAQLIAPAGEVRWFLDAAAAAGLRGRHS